MTFRLHYSSLWLPILILIFSSCEFSLNSKVFTDLPKPTISGASINLTGYTKDTIYLLSPTVFIYSANAGDKKWKNTKINLNGQPIGGGALSGSFSLDPSNIQTGYYQLRIDITTTSGSGSLAEAAGAESLEIWKNWVVAVNHSVPVNPTDPGSIKITDVKNENYSIKIYWQKYANPNFQSYELVRTSYDDNGNIAPGLAILITDPNQTSTFDNTYLGGKVEYVLKVHADNKVYQAPIYQYEHPYKPSITFTSTLAGVFTIKWNSPSALKSNFYKTQIDILEAVGIAGTETFEKVTITDTVLVYSSANFKLGHIKKLRMRFWPAGYGYTEHEIDLRLGNLFPSYFLISFDPTTGNYFYINSLNWSLNKADQNGTLLNSYSGYTDVQVSNTGDGYGIYQGHLYRFNKTTLSPDVQINTTFSPVGFIGGISDDGKIAVDNRIIQSNGQDIATLGYYSFGDAPEPAISRDGNYYYNYYVLYKYDGSTYGVVTNVANFSLSGGYQLMSVTFLPDDPNHVIFSYTRQIVKFNLLTMTPDIINTALGGLSSYEPVSKKLGCYSYSTGTYSILNIEDLQLYKSLPVDPYAGGYFFNYNIFNSTLICGSGSQIKF